MYMSCLDSECILTDWTIHASSNWHLSSDCLGAWEVSSEGEGLRAGGIDVILPEAVLVRY